MLPKSIRAYMAATVVKYLTDLCTISRAAETLDEFGNSLVEYVAVRSDVKCRVLIPPGRLSPPLVSSGAAVLADDYRLILPPDCDIKADDRVTVRGKTYSVQNVREKLTDSLYTEVQIAGVS